jgi:hypothetical protein
MSMLEDTGRWRLDANSLNNQSTNQLNRRSIPFARGLEAEGTIEAGVTLLRA